MRKLALAVAAIAIGFAAPLVVAEITLRFLPVSTGLMAQAVNETNPVFRFKENREYLWSRDWNFTIVNSGWVNGSGFVNDQDYDPGETSPLLAVIGDSYVEAAMVPYSQTLHGRLAARLQGTGRVYSFAASGAPLSQYLVWARYARDTFDPEMMVFLVFGNDFDQSILSYRQGPGFHHYSEDAAGELTLTRVDYRPSALRVFLRRSALVRYLVLNLSILERLPEVGGLLHALTVAKPANATGRQTDDDRYLGNVARTVDRALFLQSKRAVDAFFRDLPQASGLAPDRILFVVDGVRYPVKYDPDAYFVRIRKYLLEMAASRGYGTIDMDLVFFPEHSAHGTRFEFPNDNHWNGIAHGLAADAVIGSALFAGGLGSGR